MQGNPFGKYNGNELRYVTEFLENGGDFVNRLETAFSAKIGNEFAVAVNSGTSALHGALVACNVKGGEVLMPALCPAMVAFAVIHAGATPIFCDVDPETHHVSLNDHPITERTKAILGVSLHGLPIDWSKLAGGALEHYDVWTIDDCAQALGAKGIGKADITCFSFEDKKHITSGSEGGMITTNNPELATRARKFCGLGYKHMTAEAGRTSLAQSTYQDPSYERFDTIGLNYRMSQIQAAVGLGQLERLDHIVARRRACAQFYDLALNDRDDPYIKPEHSYYTYPIAFQHLPWKDLYNRFIELGGDGFYAMPQVPYREPALAHIKKGMLEICPVAENFQEKLMLFKTNYRDLGEAERQAEILAKLISEL
jgi:perosamine synthetase